MRLIGGQKNFEEKLRRKWDFFQFFHVMVLTRVPTGELELVNLRFCREKPPFTTCKRLRDDISEEGPLAKAPLCFVEVERESLN